MPAAKKAPAKSALLPKPKKEGKGYTKTQLIAHLTEAVNTKHDVGEITKKQAAALVEELSAAMLAYAPVGATLPGIGKLVLRKTKRLPKRTVRNPATGEAIEVPPKPAGQKLAFRIAKAAKDEYNK